MKKILGIVLCLVLLLSYAVADGIDLKNMSDEELNNLQNAIIAEQCERGGFDSDQTITDGEYLVGRDIRSGQFKLQAIRNKVDEFTKRALEANGMSGLVEDSMYVSVLDSEDSGLPRFHKELCAGDTVTVSLTDGELLRISGGECLIEEIKPSFAP